MAQVAVMALEVTPMLPSPLTPLVPGSTVFAEILSAPTAMEVVPIAGQSYRGQGQSER